MRLTNTETRILELFANNVYLKLSINAIAKKLQKHYRVVRVNILSLIKKNLVKSSKLAGARVITLNLKEISFPSYMAYVEETHTYNKMFEVIPQINDILKAVRELSPVFCLGFFGSYANDTQKKSSDIDIFLICNSADLKIYKTMIHQFPSVEDMIDWNVFTIDEFKKGLKAKGTLVYKEIVKNKMIISGSNLFYNMIAEVGHIEQD